MLLNLTFVRQNRLRTIANKTSTTLKFRTMKCAKRGMRFMILLTNLLTLTLTHSLTRQHLIRFKSQAIINKISSFPVGTHLRSQAKLTISAVSHTTCILFAMRRAGRELDRQDSQGIMYLYVMSEFPDRRLAMKLYRLRRSSF